MIGVSVHGGRHHFLELERHAVNQIRIPLAVLCAVIFAACQASSSNLPPPTAVDIVDSTWAANLMRQGCLMPQEWADMGRLGASPSRWGTLEFDCPHDKSGFAVIELDDADRILGSYSVLVTPQRTDRVATGSLIRNDRLADAHSMPSQQPRTDAQQACSSASASLGCNTDVGDCLPGRYSQLIAAIGTAVDQTHEGMDLAVIQAALEEVPTLSVTTAATAWIDFKADAWSAGHTLPQLSDRSSGSVAIAYEPIFCNTGIELPPPTGGSCLHGRGGECCVVVSTCSGGPPVIASEAVCAVDRITACSEARNNMLFIVTGDCETHDVPATLSEFRSKSWYKCQSND